MLNIPNMLNFSLRASSKASANESLLDYKHCCLDCSAKDFRPLCCSLLMLFGRTQVYATTRHFISCGSVQDAALQASSFCRLRLAMKRRPACAYARNA
eukprot:1712533-Pleurochrysis_carterae.AAC.3